MNFISNIWNHPKTSAAGLMIAFISITGVLSQQGITLGSAGTGTVVALVGSLATALLGLLAKDPEVASQQVSGSASQRAGGANASAKLGAWALIALLLPLPFVSGCSGKSVAQDIVNWTPALQSAVATVDSTAAMLAPADAPIFAAATVGFDAASNLLVGAGQGLPGQSFRRRAGAVAERSCRSATAGERGDSAGGRKSSTQKSQTLAMAPSRRWAPSSARFWRWCNSVSSKAAVAQMAAQSSIRLAQVRAYLNEGKAAEIVAGHYGEPVGVARIQVAQAERNEALAGF